MTNPTALNVVGTNTGHGHVWERPDGVRMRCGGPGMCAVCSADLARMANKEKSAPVPPSSKTVTPARLRNVADWLMHGCDVGHAAVELRMLAQDLESAAETGCTCAGAAHAPHCALASPSKTRGEQALDELTAQAQELGMGYGGNEPRCKTCLQPYDGNMHMCPGFPPPGACP